MGRGLGSNTRHAVAFEAVYGTPPNPATTGYLALPLVSTALGEERPLISSDLLGLGREPQDPTYDVATNTGDQVVPVDVRAFGWWLRLLMGAPVTTASGAATARIRFSALPAVNSTITINGTAFTFVASGATGNQINIGVDLATTIANAVTVLNASAVAGVALATYAASGSDLTITHDAAGPGGNAFTLSTPSASPASNAVLVGSEARNVASWAFASQPVNNSTITINGQTLTFVTSGATGNQVNIGGSVAATLAAAAAFLNASRLPAFMPAWYGVSGSTLFAILRPGVTIASYVISASTSPASNATAGASAAVIALAGGTNAHVFSSGAISLPSASIEIGQPDVPAFSMHYGAAANQLRIGLSRSGLLNASIGMIAKGEATATPATAAGATLFNPGVPTRFAQATGSITRNGSALGSVVQAEITFSNNLDPVETIQADGRIEGVDPAMVMAGASITTRFADTVLMDDATSQAPVSLTFGWTNGPFSLTFAMPRVFLPRSKRPVEGPGGIQSQATLQASGALASSMTVTLISDVPSYA
jgi:hypothetical protein